jgi:hypothetical protein
MNGNMPYSTDLEPVLSVDDTVELQPDGLTAGVETVEVFPAVTTQEVTVPANDTLNEVEIRGLYMPDGALAQLRLLSKDATGQALPTGVRFQVDQGGRESSRYNLKNQRARIDNDAVSAGDANQQTELYQYEDGDLFFTFENTTGSDETFKLKYTGYGYKLRDASVAPEETDVTVLTSRKTLRR